MLAEQWSGFNTATGRRQLFLSVHVFLRFVRGRHLDSIFDGGATMARKQTREEGGLHLLALRIPLLNALYELNFIIVKTNERYVYRAFYLLLKS